MTHISFEKAIEIRDNYLKQLSKRHRQEIIYFGFREFDFGWLFDYNTADCIKDNLTTNKIVGGKPIVIDKETGDIFQLEYQFWDMANSSKSEDEFYRDKFYEMKEIRVRSSK